MYLFVMLNSLFFKKRTMKEKTQFTKIVNQDLAWFPRVRRCLLRCVKLAPLHLYLQSQPYDLHMMHSTHSPSPPPKFCRFISLNFFHSLSHFFLPFSLFYYPNPDQDLNSSPKPSKLTRPYAIHLSVLSLSLPPPSLPPGFFSFSSLAPTPLSHSLSLSCLTTQGMDDHI